jgi:hypothetical protein
MIAVVSAWPATAPKPRLGRPRSGRAALRLVSFVHGPRLSFQECPSRAAF